MKHCRYLNLIIFFCLFFFGILPIRTVADDGADFTIIPIFNENQTDDSLGYFSIKYEKDYPIKIKIKNLNTKESSKFEVMLINATTTNTGQIDYTPSNQKVANKDALSITDFIPKDKEKQIIEVEANSEKEISIDLKKPVEQFEGVVLGSVYVKKIDTKDSNKSGITNTFAMSIPIIISQNFDKKIMPELSLSNIKMLLDMGKPIVSGEIYNTSPVMFGEINIDSWITKKNEDKKLYERKETNYEMAPNSIMNYSISLNNDMLSPGIYTYHILLKSGDKKFDLSKDFNISSQEVKKNSSSLSKLEDKKVSIWWVIIIIVGGIILGVAIVYYILRLNNVIPPLYNKNISKKKKIKNKK